MFINKKLNLFKTLLFTGLDILWLTLWIGAVATFFYFTDCRYLAIPWEPVTLVGTAVAFYVGFKNNQSYNRLWEARKIWGAIVNSSRTFGATTTAFIHNESTENKLPKEQVEDIHQRLIYRHIAWLYTLRKQLLVATPWEHASQLKHKKLVERSVKRFKFNAYDDEIKKSLSEYLKHDDLESLKTKKNMATQIIHKQTTELSELRSKGLLNDFRHMELQKTLNEFYVHQGKAERIKKFPLPRQYGGMSIIFIRIFIFLLPFSLVPEFAKLGPYGIWMSIPIILSVSWVYMIMELIGDYSENPFQGLGNDVPMLSLCRTIEIDLKEMLGEEENLPKPIEAVNGVLI